MNSNPNVIVIKEDDRDNRAHYTLAAVIVILVAIAPFYFIRRK